MRVHAYCWMTNHVHLLMQVSEVTLGRAMQRIASRYARAVQKRRGTTGHLFERRHRAILIDADSYLLELIRYIHLNPVRARIVTDPADYPWSGHRAYLGLENTCWLTADFGLICSIVSYTLPGRLMPASSSLVSMKDMTLSLRPDATTSRGSSETIVSSRT